MEQIVNVPDNPPALEASMIGAVYEEIRQVYLQYPYPWVIGYSGGKDSTTVLQLVWYALAALPAHQRTRPIHVISTDTLVETPVIVDHVNETLKQINLEAGRAGLPIQAHRLTPILDDTFWVNLIGRGYPAPTSIFRWCTERLKINPSNRFILEQVEEHGEVILVLGSRSNESATRDQVLKMHRFRGHRLSRHGYLPGAWVFMPIEEFSSDDVWTYLLQVKAPWGGDNRQLSALYRTAQSGECPLVVDKTTPSCGNSRFGCWVCTVVHRDRSMEAMIDAGEEWMIPLLNFRDWLASTQDPEVKPLQREYKSRNGTIKITNDGKLRYRTYTLEFSREMLRRLLQTQAEIQSFDPNFVLITLEELLEIRRLWLIERQDWEDSLPGICSRHGIHSMQWETNDLSGKGALEARLLEQLSEKHEVPFRLVQKLLDVEWQNYGLRRRGAIQSSIDRVLREDWRTLQEVEVEMQSRQRVEERSSHP